MKHLLSILLFALLLSACSDKENNELEPERIPEKTSISTTMGIKLSAASLTAFAAQNVTAIDVFVYLGDSLVFGENLALGDGNLQVEVPLGESLKMWCSNSRPSNWNGGTKPPRRWMSAPVNLMYLWAAAPKIATSKK